MTPYEWNRYIWGLYEEAVRNPDSPLVKCVTLDGKSVAEYFNIKTSEKEKES